MCVKQCYDAVIGRWATFWLVIVRLWNWNRSHKSRSRKRTPSENGLTRQAFGQRCNYVGQLRMYYAIGAMPNKQHSNRIGAKRVKSGHMSLQRLAYTNDIWRVLPVMMSRVSLCVKQNCQLTGLTCCALRLRCVSKMGHALSHNWLHTTPY